MMMCTRVNFRLYHVHLNVYHIYDKTCLLNKTDAADELTLIVSRNDAHYCIVRVIRSYRIYDNGQI